MREHQRFPVGIEGPDRRPPERAGPGGKLVPPGRFLTEDFAGLFLVQKETCTDTVLLRASGRAAVAAETELVVQSDLSSATLDTTINVCDSASSACFDAAIDLTWTATGDGFRVDDRFPFGRLGRILDAHLRGVFRLTEAPGVVSDGTTNFTPEPSEFAAIAEVRIRPLHSG